MELSVNYFSNNDEIPVKINWTDGTFHLTGGIREHATSLPNMQAKQIIQFRFYQFGHTLGGRVA